MLDHFLNQSGLAYGNAVFSGNIIECLILRDGLADHSSVKFIRMEKCIYLFGKLRLQPQTFFGILTIDTNQNGIGQLIEIAVPQHRANQGIDGYIQIAVFQIHVAKDLFAILIQCRCSQHSLVTVQFQLHTRVHIQRNGGNYSMILLICAKAKADHQCQSCSQGGYSGPAKILFLCHRDHSSFLHLTIGENRIKNIGCGLLEGLPDPGFNFSIFHGSSLL